MDGRGRSAATAVELRFLGHATVVIDDGATRLATDPFLRGRLGPLVRHGMHPDPRAIGLVDAVLISHAHPDHFDPASLRMLPGAPLLVVPPGLAAPAARALPASRRPPVELAPGETTTVGTWTITAVTARHWPSPLHPRAAAVGYLLEGRLGVYFAGDTGPFGTMRDLAGRVDVALLPVATWGFHRGPGHLDPAAAAAAVDLIRPAVAIPIHWATLYPAGFARWWPSPLATPGRRFAAEVERLGSATDVRVLMPGEGTFVERPAGAARGGGRP